MALTAQMGVRSQQQRRQGIGFDGHQFGFREFASGGQEEPPGPSARIDDSHRLWPRRRPTDHGLNDARWRVDRAPTPTILRCADCAERVAQRFFAGSDGEGDRVHVRLDQIRCAALRGAQERPLASRQIGRHHESAGERGQFEFGRHERHRSSAVPRPRRSCSRARCRLVALRPVKLNRHIDSEAG